MISQGLKMLKRAIEERPKGGMQTGMPKIQLREADAVRAVAELEWAKQRIIELESQLPKWIDVVDELPEPETAVLAIVDGYDGILTVERRWEHCNPMIESWYEDFLYWDWIDNDGQDFEGRVQCWMPIPPKEKDHD